jgi:hypothetical protein
VQNGSETGIDCGGTCSPCSTLLLLAGGTDSPNGVIGASFNHSTGAWTTTPLVGSTASNVALVITTAGEGVGLMRFTEIGNPLDNFLQYTRWTGTWTPFLVVDPTVTTQGSPTLVATGAGAQAAFHGFDYNHYYAAYSGSGWSPVAEPIGSSGGLAGDIAALGTNASFLFSKGLPNELYSRDRVGGSWQSEQFISNNADFNWQISPEAIALTAGPELMVVFVSTTSEIRYATRTSGIWSSSALVPGATTNDRVALTALPGGSAALAFRGQDGNLYQSGWNGATWSAPSQVAQNITGTPSIAPGAGAPALEVAFISSGSARHTRYVSGAWTTPTVVGGSNLTSVAIATAP